MIWNVVLFFYVQLPLYIRELALIHKDIKHDYVAK